jgi:hypothetical protein
MAASTRADKARQAAQQAGSNPYVRRFIEDPELRDSVKDPYRALTEDKKVQRDLRTAAENLKDASERLQGKRRKKRHPFRKLLLIGIVASVLAIALNEDLRKAVLDRLFGAEEEFEYTSQTTAAPAPAATE